SPRSRNATSHARTAGSAADSAAARRRARGSAATTGSGAGAVVGSDAGRLRPGGLVLITTPFGLGLGLGPGASGLRVDRRAGTAAQGLAAASLLRPLLRLAQHGGGLGHPPVGFLFVGGQFAAAHGRAPGCGSGACEMRAPDLPPDRTHLT